VASAPGYRYSQALMRIEGHWDENLLDAYLENPNRVAPGTTMIYVGMPNSEARQRLIEYLRTL
jgi:cytochrome c